MSHALPPLPTFSKATRVLVRPEGAIAADCAYAQAVRQYASTSVNASMMQPASIIYPATEADIVLAIRFASETGIAIAVRSGGHSYHGGSSTAGRNIQVDTTQCADCKVWQFDAQAKQLTIGTGWKLGQVEEQLQNNYQGFQTKGYFFAHGNCAGVGVGGHMHTGGYAMQTRSFGLFIDYVERFRIITADGVVRDVRKPRADTPNADNDDLWFAVLGGGPGSFGVCTQVTMRLRHDDEFPESRAYMQSYVWTQRNGSQLIEALLQHMAELSDRDHLPADFCLHLALASAAPKYLNWKNIARDAGATVVSLLEQRLIRGQRHGRKGLVRAVSGKLLNGLRAVFGTQGGRNPLLEASVVPLIIVQASWNNLSGKAADYDESVQAFFAQLDAVARAHLPQGIAGTLLQRMLRILDPRKHLPVTEIIHAFTFKGEREFDLPYMKRNWAGYETDVSRRGFAREVANLFAPFTRSIFSSTSEPWDGNAVVCAWGYLGGTHSNLGKQAAQTGTAMPHRQARIAWMSDYFYDPGVEGSIDRLQRWISRYDQKVVGADGAFFSARDGRFMFDPFDTARENGKEGAPELDRLHAHFYDDEAVYRRVLATKRRFDPGQVFSPNAFCVGGAASPQQKVD